MKRNNYIGFCIALFSLFSCKVVTKIYYNDTSKVDDGEIWGSNLNVFFSKDKNVKITDNSSTNLNVELKRIKKVLLEKGESVVKDDLYYDYAFVMKSKDTLFTNSAFEIWRYKDKKGKILNKVTEYTKATQ